MIRMPLTPAALVAPVLILALTSACGGAEPAAPAEAPAAEAPSTVELSPEDARAAGIETAPARRVERTEPVEASGVVTFDERRTARLGSLIEGVVHEIDVQPGDHVAAGARLASLHSHVVHDAWAEYFKARAEQRRVDAELAYARTAEARAAQLVADKALSPQELERARADVNAAVQALAAARAEITRSEQELRHYGLTPHPETDAEEDQDVPVRAPFAGTVIERLVTEGSAVTPGTPLVVVSDLSRVWVTAEIDEALLGRVSTGRPAAIRAAAYPGDVFEGTLAAIGDVVNPQTRRVTLRVEAANPGRRLKPQMFVRVTLGASAPRAMLVVPTRAIQELEGETVVFVRSAAGRFTRRAVTIGADVDGEVEVISGLAEGDIVATAGAFLLKSALSKPSGEDH